MNSDNTLVLDFEKNIVEIEDKIEAMRHLAEGLKMWILRPKFPVCSKIGETDESFLRKFNPVAEASGLPPSAASALPGLCTCPD